MLAFLSVLTTAFAADAPVQRVGAVHQLPDLPGLVDRWDSKRAWGTPLVVETILSVGERLAWDHPHWDPITIGDISNRGGGPMFGHKTHDLGIDADIGLFVHGGRQQDGFLDVHPDQLDAAATWDLVNALLDTGNVQFILLDQRHIERLRRYALDVLGLHPQDVAATLVPRSTPLSNRNRGVVRHAPNHSSHLHVRITPAR